MRFMEYVTANKYKDAKLSEPYEKNGKMYAKAIMKCDRCGGLGIIASRVENGQIIPIPVDNGICYACLGAKTITKEVRLYTPEERERLDRYAEAAKARKLAKQEAEMKKNFAARKATWLEKNGFTADGYTYIITGNSYSIKDELKANDWKFDTVLLWHKADPAGYEDRVIKVYVEDVFEFSAWGDGHYRSGAIDIVKNMLKAIEPPSKSEYQGVVGESITTEAIVTSVRNISTRYGISTIVTFEDSLGNIYVWFTTAKSIPEEGDNVTFTAKVKEHKEYNDVKQTIITRARIK